MEVRLDRDGRLRGVSSDLRERCCEDHSVYVYENFCRFRSISGEYLRKILCRSHLISLKIGTVVGNVTFRRKGEKLEKMARGNGLSDSYTAAPTRMKLQRGNGLVLGMKVPF